MLPCTDSFMHIYQQTKCLSKTQIEKEDVISTEGGEEGPQEEKNKGLAQCWLHLPICTCTFKKLQVPRNLQVLVSECGKHGAIYRF